jgi:hypothetical protein
METTDRGTGTLCGVHVDVIATYIGTLRPNGTMEGSGTGVVMTGEGESATFRATGVGTPARQGAISWRGALFFETTSAKLSRLNGIAVATEYAVDESGKSEGHFYEWK